MNAPALATQASAAPAPAAGQIPLPETTRSLRRPAGALASAAKYAAIMGINAHSHFAYLGESLVNGLFLVVILFVFLQLWRATYAGQGQAEIGGFTLAQMLWYLAITEAITVSRPQIHRDVEVEVRTGGIAYTLGRPYSYAGYRFASYLASRGVFFAIKLAIAVAVALLLVGPVSLHPGSLALGAAALLLAVTIDFLLSFAIALLAFWTESTASVYLIYSRLVMLLGGMLLPLEVFPEPLGSVARALPFSSLVYAPARLALGGAGEPAGVLFAKQLVTLALAAAAARALYRAAMRRVNVNGG